jgi:hypothetical protein
VSPMDMTWATSPDSRLGLDLERHLYADGRVSLRSGTAQLQLDLLPATARAAARTLTVIGHGEFCRLLRQVERETPVVAVAPPVPTTSPRAPVPLVQSPGWSRPVCGRGGGTAGGSRPTPPGPPARASLRWPLRRQRGGAERWHSISHSSAWRTRSCAAPHWRRRSGLRSAQGQVRRRAWWPPPGPARLGMALELESGDAPMPRSHPVQRLSDGELAELRAQLMDLLDRKWI